MYITPQPYKCIKCGYEQKWTPHDHQSTPVVNSGDPVCPQCWSNFLMSNLGIMYCTVNFRNGSEYDNKKKSVA